MFAGGVWASIMRAMARLLAIMDTAGSGGGRSEEGIRLCLRR